MKRFPKMNEIFHINEAGLDVDKFTSHKGRSSSSKFGDRNAPGQDLSAEFGSKSGSSSENGSKSKFEELAPQPKSNGVEKAKRLGLKKITNWYVNPKHWARAKPNEPDAIQWEGDDWLAPVSSEARTYAKRIAYSGQRPVDSVKPEVWNKFFKKDFGDMSEARKHEKDEEGEEENNIEVNAKDVHLDVVGPEGKHDIDEDNEKLSPQLEKLIADYAKILTMKSGLKGANQKTIDRFKDVLREFSKQTLGTWSHKKAGEQGDSESPFEK